MTDEEWNRKFERIKRSAECERAMQGIANPEQAVAQARSALQLTLSAMLSHAGWNPNYDETGKELPMSRPADVQAAEKAARDALAALTPTDSGK